jgi:hypothetical protein
MPPRAEPPTGGASTQLSRDLVDAARGVKAIGAPASEARDLWSWPYRPAVALAREVGARLVLADVSTRSAWTTPYGSGGVGADRAAPFSDGTTAVTKDELRLLGHEAFLAHVESAEAEGVEVTAWMADRPGVLALDRFLELFPMDALIVPPLDHPSLGDRLRGDHISAVRQRMAGRLLLIAAEDGSLQIDRP